MQYYIIDAFCDDNAKGNPAGVCVVEDDISEDVMQYIAYENNLSETAFVQKITNSNEYNLRWFTPTFEIDLCGHATLATAYVIFNFFNTKISEIIFHTKSGILKVKRNDELYEMTFPQRKIEKINVDEKIVNAFSFTPNEIYSSRDLIVVFDSEEQVYNFTPDYSILKTLDNWLGIVITAKGKDYDFVSRYFCPKLSMEDPVTGSSHCCLVPYWSEKLEKDKLKAKQLSQRGGVLYCEMLDKDVKISGKAKAFLKGQIK